MLLPFDQLKLATVLERLPSEVKIEKIAELSDAKGRIVKTVFPKETSAYSMVCESTYYSHAPYPTEASCTITFDKEDMGYTTNHEEIRIEETNREYVEALFNAISYEDDKKILRSYNRHTGVDFDGNQGNIFDFYFICSRETCDLRFSTKVLE